MMIFQAEFSSDDILRKSRCVGDERETTQKQLTDQLLDFNEGLPNGIDIYLSRLRLTEAIFHVVLEDETLLTDIERYISDLTDALSWNGEVSDIQEITIGSFGRMTRTSSFIEEHNELLAKYGLEDLPMQLGRHGVEIIIPDQEEETDSLEKCRELLCESTVLPELKRIFDKNAPRKFIAHPVQYVIMSDNEKVRTAIRELLLSSLWKAGRLQSRRAYISLDSKISSKRRRFFEPLKYEQMEKLYEAQRGGTIVLPFMGVTNNEEGNSHMASSDMDWIMDTLPLIQEYRHDVLSIIEIRRKDENLYRMICQELAGITIVKLEESIVFRGEAENYLKRRAARDHIENIAPLLEQLPASDEGYMLSDLQGIYGRWYEHYLRQEVFPGYRNIHTVGEENAAEKPKGSAYQELASLIGLKQAKETIQQMLDYHRAQSIFAAHGRDLGRRPSMHMVFKGNPGTAKTTVARLVARIMKDNGLLSVGKLIEVGRQDIVDRYVGGTAPRVKNLFTKAKGSVLFIDEAYSLVDGKRGLYGDEAISTIVQEMENQREDVVVILAGYPTEMDKLLATNPGLRSRIAFQVYFEDYSEEELIAIIKKFAKDEHFYIPLETSDKISGVVKKLVQDTSYELGNGRFARNLFEKARMRQASRIARMDVEDITDESLRTLLPEDFEYDMEHREQSMRKIGFRCA